MFSDFPLSYLMPILFLAELKSSIIGKKKPTAAKKGVGGERQSCWVVVSWSWTPLVLLMSWLAI